MEPDEIPDKYLIQANILFNLIEQIKAGAFDNQDFKSMLITICERYYAHLMGLFMLSNTSQESIKIIKVNALSSKITPPPFEKDFFINHPM